MRKHCKKLEDQLVVLIAQPPTDVVDKLKALRMNYEAQMTKISSATIEIEGLLTTEQELEIDMEESLTLEDI